jgi:hypothetical protein
MNHFQCHLLVQSDFNEISTLTENELVAMT